MSHNEPCNVYFARGLESGLLKIGATYSIPQRLRGLATTIEPVELIASVRACASVEPALHRRFARHIEVGRGLEWFRDDGAISEFIGGLPVAQRGSVKFLAVEPHGPLRYDRDCELLFPRRLFRSVAEILALQSFTRAA